MNYQKPMTHEICENTKKNLTGEVNWVKVVQKIIIYAFSHLVLGSIEFIISVKLLGLEP